MSEESRQARNFVTFYYRQKPNPAKSAEAGRPIFESVEYIRIAIPGDKTLEVDKQATDEHRAEYSREYQAFLLNKSQEAASGTPLTALGFTPERIAELEYFKVKTVEQLAGVTDGNIGNLGVGTIKERQKARDYLEVMRGDAQVSELRTALEAMKAEIASLKGGGVKEEKRAQK